MIDPLFALSGFAVGVLVGMTGVSGGSLMTPLLILIFGVHPATAVGTDLIYAAVTKSGGSLVHNYARSIDWRVVRRLASGSISSTVGTLGALALLNLNSEAASGLVTLVLSAALFVTDCVLVFGDSIREISHRLCRDDNCVSYGHAFGFRPEEFRANRKSLPRTEKARTPQDDEPSAGDGAECNEQDFHVMLSH